MIMIDAVEQIVHFPPTVEMLWKELFDVLHFYNAAFYGFEGARGRHRYNFDAP